MKKSNRMSKKREAPRKAEMENDQLTIVDRSVTVGQLNRGNKTITDVMNAIKAAENIRNPRRKQYYDICHDIALDGTLSSVMGKRIRAIKTSPFEWDGLENDNIIQNFKAPWFFDTLGLIAERKFLGTTLIQHTIENGLYTAADLIPRQMVRPEYGVITQQIYGDIKNGIYYREREYEPYILEVGKPDELGLFKVLAPYVLLKRDNLSFFAIFNEMFGMPFRVYTYDPRNPDSRSQIQSQAASQGAEAYIILPEGSNVDFKEANKAGASQTFGDLHKILNDEITISVLGQLLTTSTDGKGSYALGNVHKAVEEGINIEDMIETEYIINYQLKPKMISHGYPLEGINGKFKAVERLSKEVKVKIWSEINKNSPISYEDWWNEFGIPHPDEKTIKRFEAVQDKSGKVEPGPVKKKSQLNSNIKALYTDVPKNIEKTLSGFQTLTELKANQKGLDKAWTKIVQKLHNGTLKAGDVDNTLYTLVAEEIYKGVEKGFGKKLSGLDVDSPDYAMLNELRTNVYIFSGFKNYQTLRSAADLLLDEAGNKVSFQVFKESVLAIHNDYNINYLLTEFNMAHGQATMARKWLDIDAQKEALPFLEFSAVLDGNTRHAKYNKITARVDDPIWDWLLPLLEWGCRCTVRQLAEAELTPKKDLPTVDGVKEDFRFNAGKEKIVFPKNHAYYDVAKKDRKRAKQLFGLEIPKP